MPQQLPDDPKVLYELLRRSGLVAQNGNYRLAPFAEVPPEANGANGATASAPPVSGAAAFMQQGSTNVPIDNGDGTLTDPATGQVVSPQDAQSMWPNASDIWGPLLAGAAGGAMGYAATELAKRRGVQSVEGELLPPDAALPRPTNEFTGEYTDVGEQPRVPGRTAEVSGHPDGQPTSAKVLADRQRKLTGPKVALAAPPPSKYADIDNATMKRAQAIADQLVASRVAGKSNPKLAPVRRVSTGPLNRESILESVITAIRRAKIKPSTLARAIP